MTEVASNVSVGVQELIEKLRNQGVANGRTEADKIVSDARAEADRILEEARLQAADLVNKAKKEADFTIKAGEESLELAGRNAVLELKDFLLKQFSEQIRLTVAREMEDQGILKNMILEVAGRNSLRGEENVEVILPRKVIGVEDLREHPEALKEGSLAYFAVRQGKEMLSNGVTFKVGGEKQTGVTFRLREKNIEVELDDTAVSTMLLKHLQPRFRALLEGIIN
ncbi:MAG: hypothetical protein B0D91_09900 [Oceanospirillales bacterium LUC14_002_19_P2]|nr:MAG: hypothetical protein B0D91_09900 [Oceanospirillales bacterium LUC14_002_19_P2]